MCIVLIKHLMLTARETAQINNMPDKGFCAHRLLGFSSVHVDQHNLNIILLVVGVSQCFFLLAKTPIQSKHTHPHTYCSCFPNSVSLVNDVTKSMRPLPGPRQYIKKVFQAYGRF